MTYLRQAAEFYLYEVPTPAPFVHSLDDEENGDTDGNMGDSPAKRQKLWHLKKMLAVIPPTATGVSQ